MLGRSFKDSKGVLLKVSMMFQENLGSVSNEFKGIFRSIGWNCQGHHCSLKNLQGHFKNASRILEIMSQKCSNKFHPQICMESMSMNYEHIIYLDFLRQSLEYQGWEIYVSGQLNYVWNMPVHRQTTGL